MDPELSHNFKNPPNPVKQMHSVSKLNNYVPKHRFSLSNGRHLKRKKLPYAGMKSSWELLEFFFVFFPQGEKEREAAFAARTAQWLGCIFLRLLVLGETRWRLEAASEAPMLKLLSPVTWKKDTCRRDHYTTFGRTLLSAGWTFGVSLCLTRLFTKTGEQGLRLQLMANQLVSRAETHNFQHVAQKTQQKAAVKDLDRRLRQRQFKVDWIVSIETVWGKQRVWLEERAPPVLQMWHWWRNSSSSEH